MPDTPPKKDEKVEKAEKEKGNPAVLLTVITASVTLITALLGSPVLLALVNRTPVPATVDLATERPAATREATLAPGQEIPTIAVATPAPKAILECFDTSVWQLYPANLNPAQTNGCWNLADWGLTAQNGQLAVAFAPAAAETRGVYAPFSGDADLRFLFRLDQLKIPNRDEAQVLVGVVNASNASPFAGSFLTYAQTKANASSVAFSLKGENQTEQKLSTLDLGTQQEVTLAVRGTQLTVSINGQTVGQPINVAYSQKAFWLGYVLPSGTSAQATLTGLSITPR